MLRIKVLTVLVTLSALVAGIIFFIKESKNGNSNQAREYPDYENKLKTPTDVPYKESCYFQDSLTYKYYGEPDENEEVQQNIGYKNNKFGLYVYSC